jgi:hypothetical protein
VESSRGRKLALLWVIAGNALVGVIGLVSVLIFARVVGDLVIGDVVLGSEAANDASDLLGWEVGRKEEEPSLWHHQQPA